MPDGDHPDLTTCPTTGHKHDWRLTDVRSLQGVDPPTTVKDWVCDNCNLRKQTEDPIV